jgi:hypothetical protein
VKINIVVGLVWFGLIKKKLIKITFILYFEIKLLIGSKERSIKYWEVWLV